VVPENRPGAAGNIGLEAGAKAHPDGYTITLTAPPIAVSPSLYAKLNYNAIRDFAPVSLVAAIQNVMVVHNSVPAKTVRNSLRWRAAIPASSTSARAGRSHQPPCIRAAERPLQAQHGACTIQGLGSALVALISGEVDMEHGGAGGDTDHPGQQGAAACGALRAARARAAGRAKHEGVRRG